MRALVALAFVASGCLRAAAGFHCAADSDCVNGGTTGVCTAGFCSFTDSSCASGLRYGEQSGPVANECAAAADAGVDAPIDSHLIDAGFMSPMVAGSPALMGVTDGGDTMIQFSATVPPGNHRFMIVSVVMSASMTTDTMPMVGSVTFGAAELTFLGAQTGMTEDPQASRTEQWTLLEPDVSTANVTVLLSSSATTIRASAVAFTGVNQAEPIRPGSLITRGGGGMTGQIVVSSAIGDLVECVTGHGGGVVSAGTGDTLVFIDPNGDSHFSLNSDAFEVAPGSAQVAMSWNYLDDDNIEMVAASIEPVPQ